MVDEYRKRLAECGFSHQLTFELVDEKSHPLFLVFGTGSDHGVEKMKDAMWHVDPGSGSHFRDPRDPNQIAFDLSDSAPDLRVLRNQILDSLKEGPRSLADLQRFALLETIFKGTHATAVVKGLEADHLVEARHARAHSDYEVRLAPPTLF